MAQFSFLTAADSTDLADDVRGLFDELAQTLPREQRAYSGECSPTLDVLETDDRVEVIVDVAGVPAEALRVLFRSGVLVVAGEKAPARPPEPRTYHLVERDFGRFARAVRLNGSYDVARTSASLHDGELTITLPKLADRRGQPHRIAVAAAAEQQP